MKLVYMKITLRKSLIFVLSFLIFGAGCGSPLGKNNQPAEENNNQTDTIDTSDWEEYSNEEYGFSFWYPREWGVNNTSASNLSYALGDTLIFSFNISSKTDHNYFQAGVTELALNEIVTKIEQNENFGFEEEEFVRILSDEIVGKEKKRIVEASHPTAFGPVSGFYFVSFPNYPYSFFFTSYISIPTNKDVEENVLETVISSLKFFN